MCTNKTGYNACPRIQRIQNVKRKVLCCVNNTHRWNRTRKRRKKLNKSAKRHRVLFDLAERRRASFRQQLVKWRNFKRLRPSIVHNWHVGNDFSWRSTILIIFQIYINYANLPTNVTVNALKANTKCVKGDHYINILYISPLHSSIVAIRSQNSYFFALIEVLT